jgi:hypothetical protein
MPTHIHACMQDAQHVYAALCILVEDDVSPAQQEENEKGWD